jgi:5-methylcytosine-specific restriction endonuclease McrA
VSLVTSRVSVHRDPEVRNPELRALEERYHSELLNPDERLELREEILRLKGKAVNREKLLAQKRAYYAANREKVLAQNKEWWEANAEKVTAQQKAYREANREKVAATKKAHYEANREQLAVYNKAWRKANRNEWAAQQANYYESNRQKIIAKVKAWREANPDAYHAQGARRRARKKSAQGEVSAATLTAMYEDQQGLCAYCEKPLLGDYHPDHMQPLSAGGAHDWSNIALTCPTCNLQKNAKTAEEFMELVGEEERLELRDRINRLRRKAETAGETVDTHHSGLERMGG